MVLEEGPALEEAPVDEFELTALELGLDDSPDELLGRCEFESDALLLAPRLLLVMVLPPPSLLLLLLPPVLVC